MTGQALKQRLRRYRNYRCGKANQAREICSRPNYHRTHLLEAAVLSEQELAASSTHPK